MVPIVAVLLLSACAHAQVHLPDGRAAVARAPFHARVSVTIYRDDPEDGPARPAEEARAESWGLPQDWKQIGAVGAMLIGAVLMAF